MSAVGFPVDTLKVNWRYNFEDILKKRDFILNEIYKNMFRYDIRLEYHLSILHYHILTLS